MLVYFSGSAQEIRKDIELYRMIIRCIQEAGGILTYNWIEVAAFRGALPEHGEWWSTMCQEVQSAMNDVDVMVVEATGRSTFGVGYEVAQMLSQGKPVFALVQKGHPVGSYVSGIKHPCLTIRHYEPENLPQLVKEFMSKVKG